MHGKAPRQGDPFPSLSGTSRKGSGAPPHDAHLAPRLVYTLTEVHDILQLAHVRRQREYIPLAVGGAQLLGEHFQRVKIGVGDGHFEPEAMSPASEYMSAHLGEKKN